MIIIYNYISPFPLNLFMHPLLLTFKFISSFFDNCHFIHKSICIYILLKYNLFISYTIPCMCASMVDHLALGNQLVFFQLSSVAYSSFCRVHASWSFRHPTWHIHWCHDCSAYVRAVIFVKLYGCSSDLTRIHNMTQIPWSSGSYTLSTTSSAVSSEP